MIRYIEILQCYGLAIVALSAALWFLLILVALLR